MIPVLDSSLRSLGLTVARFVVRRMPTEVVSFTDVFSSAHRVLLIMPLEKREDLPTAGLIDFLKLRFGQQNITVISDDHGREVMPLLPRGRFIHILKDELSPFRIARPALITRIRERQHDIAIDLNLDFVMPSAYICTQSNARVRVGFVRPRADVFYNFLIQQDPGLDRRRVYDRMVAFLQMF
jgi:ADP-heptose:LPS heptosyltransferase